LLIALRPAGRARRQGAAEGTTGKKMKCYAHPDAEAVAICVQCGKGICPDCAGKTASGTYVCSATCARGRAARPDALNGYFLYSLGAVLGAAAVFYFVQGPWQMSVFLALAAFFSYLRGTRSQLNGSGRTELYYRIGDAMEKTHRFRQCLAELLTLHAKLSDAPITLAQLDAADESRKTQRLEQVYGEIQRKAGKEFFPWNLQAKAQGDAQNLQFCQLLAENYFEKHAAQLKSVSGRSRLERQLWHAHMPLRESISSLSGLNRQLATESGRSEKR
jgi:hypothetical protein